jgi:hypothetical protein
MALTHVDDAVRACFAVAKQHILSVNLRVQHSTPTRARWGEVCRENGFSRHSLPCGSKDHAVGHKTRKHLLIGVLQLTTTAFAKVAARRNNAVWSRKDCATGVHQVSRNTASHMLSGSGDAITLRSQPDDFVLTNQRNEP